MTALEALEHYTSAHADTFEDILVWPWLRFERCYEAFMLREQVDRLDRQRDLIVASLHANSVFDEHKEADRQQAVRGVEQSFAQAVDYLYAVSSGEGVQEAEIDEDSAFWSAAKRGAEKLEMPRSEGDPDATAEEAVEGERAMEEVREAWRAADQS